MKFNKYDYECIKRASMAPLRTMSEIEALEKFKIFDLMFSSCSALSKTPKSKFSARLVELVMS